MTQIGNSKFEHKFKKILYFFKFIKLISTNYKKPKEKKKEHIWSRYKSQIDKINRLELCITRGKEIISLQFSQIEKH